MLKVINLLTNNVADPIQNDCHLYLNLLIIYKSLIILINAIKH